ncbi:DUF6443 domain-containing protein [Olivibacter ginsenosidimutans]|uniref:DUF6443 domain-containing protein n=2 Tax=Olivibacter ginsenosidimutans TaxID=1176537 RepID=A0ABP9AG33_9SPHI
MIALILLLVLPSAVQAQLVLNTPTTGEKTDPVSITLKPGFSTSSFHAYITSLLQPVALGSAPSAGQNYIRTRTYLKDAVSASPQTDELMEDVAYFDGLGRPVQRVGTKAGAAYQDIVSQQSYDTFGREDKSYLPYATSTAGNGSYKGDAVTAQASFYNSGTANGVVTIPKPSGKNTPSFSRPVYEASPLNRVLEQGFAGSAWQPAADGYSGGGHSVRTEYTTNNNELLSAVEKTRKVMLYRVGYESNGRPKLELTASQSYGSNQLYVTVSRNENWAGGTPGTFAYRLNTTEEYRDKQGRVVLKRTFNAKDGSTQEMLSTYYVYDDFGNLCYVLTPGGTPDRATLPTGTALQAWLDRYAYQYQYDGRNRMKRRHVPGRSHWESFNYNLMDQLILHETARDSAEKYDGFYTGSRYHHFYKYDGQGRVVMTGVEKDRGNTQEEIEGYINAVGQAQWEERSTAIGNLHGYTNVSIPTASGNFDVLEVNYYDRYAGIPDLPSNLDKSSDAAYSKMTQGLPVAKKTKVLGTTDTYLWTVYYYDERGDNVRTLNQHYKGGAYNTNNYDDIKNEYTFTHQLKKSTREHHAGSATASLVVITEYSYDHRDRPVDTWKTVKSGSVQGTRTLVARNEYNGIGQLKAKQLHSTDGNTFGQRIAYSYNERGWLRTANAALFSQELRYNTGTQQYYNGNIAYQLYSRKAGGTVTVRDTFSYTYDNLDRLRTAALPNNRAREGMLYDKLGNLEVLNRRDQSGTEVDALSYTYNAKGQLSSVTDARTAGGTGTPYMPGGTTSYSYDANGNQLTRVNSGSASTNITATVYNYLDLPQRITVGGTTITYTYDGTGRKLRSVNAVNGEARDYIDGIEYAAGTLDFVQMEEGRLVNKGSNNYGYEYFLKDHLGNTRSGFAGTAPATPTFGSDYYAFGLQVQQNLLADNPKNSYLYNGKELQDRLGMYDYGARFYDPVIGRWGSVDPLAESFQSYSPYNYGLNNPIVMTDPTGLAARSTHTDSTGNVVAVYNDGDLGVYRHDNASTKTEVDAARKKSGDTAGGGEKMGETEYWDEFIVPGTNKAGGSIHFSKDPEQSWDVLVAWGNRRAKNQDLSITQEESKLNGVLDIKNNRAWADAGPMTGRLLNGKYATARSAGNYLAGMNGVTGTFQGRHISGETYMKLAGAYQVGAFSKINILRILMFGAAFGPAPYYGEEPYSGRRILEGIKAGSK